MGDPRELRRAREQVEEGTWRIIRMLEESEADRHRWRATAVTWARMLRAGQTPSPDAVDAILAEASS